jgi:hypothetical protein
VVEASQVDELDVAVAGGSLSQVVGEASSAEAHEACLLGRGGASGGEEFADVPEALEVAKAHGVVPFGFADGQERFAAVGVVAEDGDVDFVATSRADAAWT